MSQPAIKDLKALIELGWTAADFSLKGTDGKTYTLADVRGPKGLMVMFICNHCPYVKSALDRIIHVVNDAKALGVGTIAISSNDTINYPADSFENMQKLATEKNLPFPYVIDTTQDVARAYDAACTPEFYVFDADLKLAYHGRIDSGGKNEPAAGAPRELFIAIQSIASTGKGPAEQHASIGCSIKWK